MPREISLPHSSLIPFVEMVYRNDKGDESTNKPIRPIITIASHQGLLSENYPDWKLSKKDKRCLLGFSGGKDSIAMAIKLMNEGYDVTGVFVGGLNRSALTEKQASIDACKLLGIDLIKTAVKTSGQSERRENPTKNLMILGLMLDIGGPQGIAHYALGTEEENEEGLEWYHTSWDFSDNPRVLKSGSFFFQGLENFKLHVGKLGFWGFDSYATVMSHPKGRELLEVSRSCMSRYMYQNSLNATNRKKYGVDLMIGRCGSCWKCCLEYLHLTALGIVKPNVKYIDHCWSRLSKFDEGTKEWISMMRDRLSLVVLHRAKGKQVQRVAKHR